MRKGGKPKRILDKAASVFYQTGALLRDLGFRVLRFRV